MYGTESISNRMASRRQILRVGATGISVLALAPLLAACDGSGTPSPAANQGAVGGGGKAVANMTWALYDDPVSMDPAFAYDFNTSPVVLCMVENLLRFSSTGQLEPYLASSWKAVDSTTYVYNLRQGVKFHDGSEMTAADAAASLQHILEPSVGSYLATFVANVKSVAATGQYELTVKLSRPDALWQYVPATSAGGVMPKTFLDRHGKDTGNPNIGIVGTGPYKFVEWQQGQHVRVQRNSTYWNTARTPKVGEIAFRVLTDESTVIEGMVAGQIDGYFNMTGKGLKALSSADNMRVITGPSYFIHYLGLNVNRPPFNDVRVRQALSYAIDKQGVLDSTWGGAGSLSKSPVPPALWSFESDAFESAYEALPDFALDLDKAKSLIHDAGAQGQSATILVSTPHEQEKGLIIQAAAKSIGLDFNLQQIPYTQMLAKFGDESHDFDGFISEWTSDYPDPSGIIFQCFVSSHVTDYSNYDVPAVNAALEHSSTTTDPSERAKDLIAAQKQIVEDQPFVILYTPTTNMPLAKNLGGYAVPPLWYWDSGWAADISGS